MEETYEQWSERISKLSDDEISIEMRSQNGFLMSAMIILKRI